MKLSQLRNVKNLVVDKVANALDDTLNNNLTSEEILWVDKIEETRRRFKDSSTEISITDYGAGTPNIKRNKEEMYHGTVSTITISRACEASEPYFWSLFLFKLVREFRPLTCIELGTCLGISAAYQASAQKVNREGKIVTLEGAVSLASLAEENLQQLGLDNAIVVSGRFQDNLERVLKEYNPIDYAYIDGHHDGDATVSYFEQFLPYLSPKSIIIFDDISWSEGMHCAWKKIEQSEFVRISLDLRTLGVCVLDESIEEKYSFSFPII